MGGFLIEEISEDGRLDNKYNTMTIQNNTPKGVFLLFFIYFSAGLLRLTPGNLCPI